MKFIYFIFIFLTASLNSSLVYSQTKAEDLIKSRDTLYNKYQLLKNKTDGDSSVSNLKKLTISMEDIIEQDNDIVDIYNTDISKIKNDSIVYEAVSKENTALKNIRDSKQNLIFIILPITAITLALSILFLFLLILTKRKTARIERQYLIDKQAIDKYNYEKSELEKEIAALKENQNKLSYIPGVSDKTQELELNLIMLEKLCNLKENGLISEIEFASKKREVLNKL